MPLLEVKNLTVAFDTSVGTFHAVRGIDLSVDAREVLAIVGESGSGKSVAMLSVMGLLPDTATVTADKLSFDGHDLLTITPEARRKIIGKDVAMIFQEPMTSLNPVFTIERQLIDGLMTHRRLSREAAAARALELLKEVRIPEPERRLKQYPHELSGGMRQRVVIAIAMACSPRLLIADEPTTALDVTIQAEILALIDRLKRENGMSVLFITHDMAVVAQMADRVVVMFRGNIVEQGPVEDIFENPREDYTKALLAAVPRLGEMRGKREPERMAVVGPNVTAPAIAADEKPRAQPRVLLDVQGLTTRFPVKRGPLRLTVANVHAVEDVSLRLNVGETLALVGESGCGKSTTGRSILRLVEPMAGSVSLDGWDVRGLGAADLRRARRDMQMIFQDPFASLNPYRRLRDQVAEPLVNFALARGKALDERVATLFDQVELPRSFMSRFPHELSGGQRQRVAIARALATDPKLIVADEAVSALDVSVRAQILNLMMDLQQRLGVSFLFISHDMAVVERVSHNVGVMYLGRLVEFGSRQQIFENPRHEYTRTLLAAVPIADPRQRRMLDDKVFRSIPSPVHPAGYRAPPSLYDEIEPGHLVLRPN